MCGIVGLFALDGGDPAWPEAPLQGMVTALAHRGPNGQGRHREPGLFLGHTRLAVQDLSPAGRQPMVSPGGRFVISYNGEIYRFQELRQELAGRGVVFRTRTDTEVLLAAWEQWGAAALERLDGMFAFALWDRRERRLTLARDPLGIKPLFYYTHGHRLAFASEPAALFGPLLPLPAPDAADLDSFFTFNYLAAPRSGWQGVRQLPPGHLLEARAGEVRVTPFHRHAYDPDPHPWSPRFHDRFRATLESSVAAQLVADAPLGVFLSGGQDSAAVVGAAVATAPQVQAYCLGFEGAGFDESPAARRLAGHLGIPCHVEPFRWDRAILEETLAVMRGELLADASCFPMFQIARRARQEQTVMLAGDGGDELLAGYDTYLASRITPWLARFPAEWRRWGLVLAARLPSDQRRYGWRMVAERLLIAAGEGVGRDHASFRHSFTPALKARLYTAEFRDLAAECDPLGDYAGLMAEVPGSRSRLTAYQHADLVFHLPSVLAKVDRMSMAHGLEVRVPLLGREVVAQALNLPDRAKRRLGRGKWLLRHYNGELYGVDRPRGAKAGFLPPVQRWFRREGVMAGLLQERLDWARGRSLGWLRWDEVVRLLEEHQAGATEAGFPLLGVLQFLNWVQGCGERGTSGSK